MFSSRSNDSDVKSGCRNPPVYVNFQMFIFYLYPVELIQKAPEALLDEEVRHPVLVLVRIRDACHDLFYILLFEPRCTLLYQFSYPCFVRRPENKQRDGNDNE